MQKRYRMVGLNCSNCANKIEEASKKLNGVISATLNLPTQTLVLELSEDHDSNALYIELDKTVRRFEKHVSTIPLDEDKYDKKAHEADHNATNEHKKELLLLSLGTILLIVGAMASEYLLYAAYIVLAYPILLTTLTNIRRLEIFDENFLMSIASIGALLLGEAPEACAVMLFYRVGELLTDRTVTKSRSSIKSLANLKQDTARLVIKNVISEVPTNAVVVGDKIEILPGARVPLDCVVVGGNSTFDTSAITGESAPRIAEAGNELLAGFVNGASPIIAKVTKLAGESAMAKIIKLTEEAITSKAPSERFITKFAKVYTPIVVALATIRIFIPFGGDLYERVYQALTFLVVSCPCALVLSVPLSFFAGLGASSKAGMLVKGSTYLEELAKVDSIALDKTGTITTGEFEVTGVHPENGMTEGDLIELAATIEASSTHPLAKSIVSYYGSVPKAHYDSYHDVAGLGIECTMDSNNYLLGNYKLFEKHNIVLPESAKTMQMHLAKNNAYIGSIALRDKLRNGTLEAIESLRLLGIKDIAMLTGDTPETAKKTALEANITEVHHQLLPQDKLAIIKKKSKTHKTAFIGDGINDSPVLASANVGIAIGLGGSDSAIETAGMVMLNESLLCLPNTIKIARHTMKLVKQNIAIALMIKFVVMTLAVLGYGTMWMAVIADVGASTICVLNAMRGR